MHFSSITLSPTGEVACIDQSSLLSQSGGRVSIVSQAEGRYSAVSQSEEGAPQSPDQMMVAVVSTATRTNDISKNGKTFNIFYII